MKLLWTAILLVFTITTQVRATEQSSDAPQAVADCKRFATVDFGKLKAGNVIATCQSALRINPDDYQLRGLLGRGFFKAGHDEMALYHIQHSADKGYVRAITLLGHMYKFGRGVTQNDREAVRLFRKAADSGHAAGMQQLGLMYKLGRGVKQDDREAVRLYRKAVKKGDFSAMTLLGLMYKSGRGVLQDDREAVRLFREAAENGQGFAMSFLAEMYLRGRGVKQDGREGLQWVRKAADTGGASGMTATALLAAMYAEGRVIQQDDREAVRLFRKTADKGYARSMYWLGFLYEAGRGTNKNSRIAASHVFASLKAGDKNAPRKLAKNPSHWSKEFYLELQRLLQKEGVYSGPLNGQPGPALQKSIKALLRK